MDMFTYNGHIKEPNTKNDLTLLSLSLPLSSSTITSRELLRNSRLVVDEDDLMWFKN